ncbi:carboxypeptidase regulatory-like domain-containing protein [bacterium]|nr:carboxypeptidase regulatory-like domain-containing protein [bacterium]
MKKIIISTLFVFAVLAFLISCGGTEESSGSGGIYGHVTDFITGEDVANANVQLRPGGDTTLTGSDGMFEFRDLTSGDYSITVSKAGYSDLVDDYVITVKDKMVKRDIQLEKKKAEVAMLDILDNEGNPINELDFGTELISRQFQIYNAGPKTIDCTIITDGYSAEWVTSVSLQSPLTVKIEPGAAYGAVATIDRSKLPIGQNTTSMQVTTSNGNKELIIKATNSECKEDGYFFNGSICVNPCEKNPCGDHGTCDPKGTTTYECDCENDYFSDGLTCLNPCEKNPCGNGICDPTGVTTYDCSCENGYFWNNDCHQLPQCDSKNITPCVDAETNYMWSSRALQAMNWDSAISYCENLTEGSFSDWILPPSDILKTLCAGSQSKLGDTGSFWSSTTGDSSYASYVYFSSSKESCASKYDYDYRSKSFSVRCVRY